MCIRDRYAHSDWPQKLARYHRDPDAVFRAWHDTWLAPEFRAWSTVSYTHLDVYKRQSLKDTGQDQTRPVSRL